MDDVDANNDTSRLSYVLQSNHAYNTNKFKNCKVVLRKFMVYLTKLQWNMGLLRLVIGSNFSMHLGTAIGWSSLMLLMHQIFMRLQHFAVKLANQFPETPLLSIKLVFNGVWRYQWGIFTEKQSVLKLLFNMLGVWMGWRYQLCWKYQFICWAVQ